MAKDSGVPIKRDEQSRRSDDNRGLAPSTWREEIDDLFDEFASAWAMAPLRRRASALLRPTGIGPGRGGLIPAFDVADKDKEIRIRAELPGMDESDIDVRLSDGALTVSGEKKEEREEGDQSSEYYLSERRYGAFRRSIPLPEGVDRDHIEAKFRKGVLTIRVPKTAEAQKSAKRIEVQAD